MSHFKIIIFTVFLFLSCKNEKSTSNDQLLDVQISKEYQTDSITIYRVNPDLLDNPSETAIIVSLTDDELSTLEEQLESRMENISDDHAIIPLGTKDIIELKSLHQYDSLYFYKGDDNSGQLKKLKRMEYHLTPMDIYVVAVYDAKGADILYASTIKEMETDSWLTKSNKLPLSFSDVKPRDAEANYYTCERYHLLHINTEIKSELYFYEFDEKPKVVFNSKDKVIFSITPLPVFRNKLPLLFASIADPNMDGMTEEVLMEYDGNKYQISKHNKIKK